MVFCPRHCSLCGPLTHEWRLPCTHSGEQSLERLGKARLSARACRYRLLAQTHPDVWNPPAQPEIDDIRHWKTNSRTITEQNRDHGESSTGLFLLCFEDVMTASGKTRGGQGERHVFSLLSRSRNGHCEDGPRITSYRGSPTYTIHVTCHSFQVSNQRVPSSSAHPLQRAGHGRYTRLEMG